MAAAMAALAAACDGTGTDRGESTPNARPAGPPPVAAPAEQAPPAPPRPRDVVAPAGTELRLELTTSLSSETAQAEAPVSARVLEAVVVDDVTVIPAGAVLHGTVIDVERAGRVRGRSHLAFRFTEIAVEGQRDAIRTRELTFEGEATLRDDATKVGTGAGIGAVIGGIVGGGGGAAKGAAIGGAAGAGAVLATRGREVELPAGSVVTTALASPYGIQVEVR